MKFEITFLRSNSVWVLYRMRDRIQLDPEYQRLGDIWTDDQRQLLIDTVINDFDIPKIYLHKFHEPLKKSGRVYDYAIIDGKQRLETFRAFIEGEFALAKDFEYFKNSAIHAGSMKYTELGRAYPDLKVQFDNFPLAVVCIDTSEIEIIEEMFTRLNEAATLTAPERRQAFGGPLPSAIKSLSREPFFTKSLPFANKRYRHFDLAAKFLLTEHEGKIPDTKKVYLDNFVHSFAGQPRNKMPSFLKQAQENTARMAVVFTKNDLLLRQIGMVTLYYHLFRVAHNEGWGARITRKALADFNELRAANRIKAETDLGSADYDLLEFDRYTQAPNDGYAIRLRLQILLRKLVGKEVAVEDL
jgi:hypothetical protein